MVSIVKLSSQNFDIFKNLSSSNLNEESYDRDFFCVYRNSSFIPKILMKKFVKLFVYNGTFIGYIWHEVPNDFSIKILSLYIDPEYVHVINKNTLRSFDSNVLVYESLENDNRELLLSKFGFYRVNMSFLMTLDIKSYNNNLRINKIKDELSHLADKSNFPIVDTFIYFSNPIITYDKVETKSDLITRWSLQNEIFHDENRIPIQIEDIENDVTQDYYINDLAYFIKFNGTPVGYGQVIFSREMYTIVNFGIIDDYRGLGLGKLLLDFLIKKAKSMEIENLYLRVEKNNFNAIKLYNWIGFTNKSNITRWERR